VAHRPWEAPVKLTKRAVDSLTYDRAVGRSRIARTSRAPARAHRTTCAGHTTAL